jgi:hypothetical protein
MTRHSPPIRSKDNHWLGLMVCVGLLGATAALVLRPTPPVVAASTGVLLLCLLVVGFRVLRRAGHRIDRILAEELDSDVDTNPVPGATTLRRTA